MQSFLFNNNNNNNNDNNSNNNNNNNFGIQTVHLISARRLDPIAINWKIVHFAVLADHRIKLKESEKKEKYLDLARELKKKYRTWRWWLYQLWLVHSV